jgi:hypothetical protein
MFKDKASRGRGSSVRIGWAKNSRLQMRF